MRRRDPTLPKHISAFLHEVRYVDVGMIASCLGLGDWCPPRFSCKSVLSCTAISLLRISLLRLAPKPLFRCPCLEPFVRAVITTDCLIWSMRVCWTAPAESAVCIELALWVSAAQYRHVKGLESSRSNFIRTSRALGCFLLLTSDSILVLLRFISPLNTTRSSIVFSSIVHTSQLLQTWLPSKNKNLHS